MSFFEDASLVLIPSAQKTSKVYSVKPTDGTGDLTFTRTGDTATRVGPDGLIEKVRTNLLTYSNDFSNAAWTKNAGATITSNTTIAPDGTLTADTLNVATTVFSGIYQAISSTSNSYTVSLFVKKGTKDFIYLFDLSVSGTAWFNLTNNTLGAVTAGFTATITSVGDGWVRITMRRDQAVTPAFFQIGLSDADGVSTPATTGTAFIWGAQAEVSDFGATPYIPTTTAAVSVGPVANVPRLDYLGSTCGKLILEPQRTNLALYSEQINTGFTASQAGTGVAPVITANNAISPDGYQNADTVFFDAGAGTTASDQSALYQFFGGTTATYTASFYAKTPSGTAQIQVRIDGSAYEKFTITNQWQRFTLTRALTGTGNGIDIAIRRGLNEPMNATATIQLWGVQVELGAYATSYIPTLGAAVTRGADAANKTSASALIGQTEGTIFVEANRVNKSSDWNFLVTLQDQATTSFIELLIDNSNTLVAQVLTNNANYQTIISPTLTNGVKKIAVAYKAGDFVLYINGVQIGTNASVTIPALNEFTLGYSPRLSPTQYADGIAQALLFKTRLTNAQLAELTTI